MIDLILDYNTWRCGAEGPNKLGEGTTALLNDEGYMCCLGQFSKQLNPEVEDRIILGHGVPSNIDIEIQGLTFSNQVGMIINTALTTEAININDNPESTPREKIERLTALFYRHGYSITVINKRK